MFVHCMEHISLRMVLLEKYRVVHCQFLCQGEDNSVSKYKNPPLEPLKKKLKLKREGGAIDTSGELRDYSTLLTRNNLKQSNTTSNQKRSHCS